MEKEKTRRPRRSQVAIERDILESVMEIVRESGFQKVSLVTVAEKAGVQLSVIYRHFGTIEQLIDRYVQSLDYWLNTVFNLSEEIEEPTSEYYKLTLQKLVSSLYKSQEVQKLLVWEISEDIPTTRRTLKRRELVNAELVRVFNKRINDDDLDIAALSALLIGGIYYVTISRKQSRFCDIDFATKQGRERLSATVGKLCDMIFASKDELYTAKKIARSLKENGVATDVICKSTSLSKEIVNEL